MPYKVIPEDFTVKLARIQAELARRNGNGDLSGYATIDFGDGTPLPGDKFTIDHINTLITGLSYINSIDLPDEAVFGVTRINSNDLGIINSVLTAFESQPRSATSGNDCENLCSGMCVDQCTTTCLSTCTSDCAIECSDNCTGSCTGSCTGTCTSCTGCTGGCTSCSGCTGGCSGTCTSCSGCTGCTGCSGTCTGECLATCYVSCDKGSGPS